MGIIPMFRTLGTHSHFCRSLGPTIHHSRLVSTITSLRDTPGMARAALAPASSNSTDAPRSLVERICSKQTPPLSPPLEPAMATSAQHVGC